MKRGYLLLTMGLILCLAAGEAKAQAPAGGASPDSKMLGGSSVAVGLRGTTTPELFNGSLNVNIPIYSFQQDKEDYGVSISYNTQGVKVDEFSSRVGLHWNLNYGASIVRIVRDLPDEMTETSDSLLIADDNEHFVTQDSIIYIPNKEMHIYGRLSAYNKDSATLKASNAYYDKECDEFIVSLDGVPFKFYIGKDLKIFSTSSKYVKIQLLAGNAPLTSPNQLVDSNASTLNFKITDNKGISYYFQPFADNSFLLQQRFWDWENLYGSDTYLNIDTPFVYPVNWSLKEIVFPDGQKISYHYSSIDSYASGYDPQRAIEDYLTYNVLEATNSLSPFDLGVSKPNQYMPSAAPGEIDYPNNVKVLFLYDTFKINVKREPLLKGIKIASGSNCKQILFFQDSTTGRYYLDSLVQVSCDSSKREPYFNFTYNPIIQITQGTPPDTEYAALPKRLFPAQDLYGYYDADSIGTRIDPYSSSEVDKQISIPLHYPNMAGAGDYGNQREYVSKYAQAGLLTSVKNAYGGTAHFYYGANILSAAPLSGIIPTGSNFFGAYQPDGVCIDSIVRTDTTKPGYKLVTTFQYSGGQLFMPGGYFDYPVYIDSVTGNWEQLIYQSEFLTSHQLINNSNHGYSDVIVENKADGLLLSKKEYTFTNMEDSTSNNQPRYYHVPGSKDYFDYPYTDKQYLKDWEIGLPLTVTDYDQNNHIVKEIINHYDFSQPTDLSAASYIPNEHIEKVNSGTYETLDGFSPQLSFEYYYPNKKTFTDLYYPFKGIAPLDYTVSRTYVSDTRFIPDTVWYYYDNHNNLSNTITQDSKGQQTETKLIYNYDVDGPDSLTGLGYSHPGTTLYNMTDSGLEEVVSTERWELNPANILSPEQSLLSAYITKYQYQNGKLWTAGLLNTDIGSPVPYSQYTGDSMNSTIGETFNRILSAYNTSDSVDNFIKTSNVTLFDAKGNPLESRLFNQDQYKAMVWNPVSGQKIADAANCHYADIAYTSFEDSLQEGNLAFTGQEEIISSNSAITGTHVGLLYTQTVNSMNSSLVPVTIHGTQNLDTGETYLLSFWLYGAAPQVMVGSQVIPVTTSSIVYTKGNWHNCQVRFTPSVSGELTITGTAPFSLIDEIRLYPAGAQMKSWTYDPLFGKSSYTDPSGRVTYYQYDKMGRGDMTLDQDGNVLSKTDYHMAH